MCAWASPASPRPSRSLAADGGRRLCHRAEIEACLGWGKGAARLAWGRNAPMIDANERLPSGTDAAGRCTGKVAAGSTTSGRTDRRGREPPRSGHHCTDGFGITPSGRADTTSRRHATRSVDATAVEAWRRARAPRMGTPELSVPVGRRPDL